MTNQSQTDYATLYEKLVEQMKDEMAQELGIDRKAAAEFEMRLQKSEEERQLQNLLRSA